jgi:hypothetical protein
MLNLKMSFMALREKYIENKRTEKDLFACDRDWIE